MSSSSSRDRNNHYDLVVIGGGGAGLTCAKAAARYGARVLLVERAAVTGGDCTWTGCIPSKALLKCAHVMHNIKNASSYGITFPATGSSGAGTGAIVNFKQVRAHWQKCQKNIYEHDDSPDVLSGQGVEVRTLSEAVFVTATELELHPCEDERPHLDDEGEEGDRNRGSLETRSEHPPLPAIVTTDKVVLAVGATPIIPTSILGLSSLGPNCVVTSDTIWNTLKELPRAMIVLGGGPIGCELAQAMARLGCIVTLVTGLSGLLPKESPVAREIIAKALEVDGVHVEVGKAKSVVRADAASASASPSASELKMFSLVLIAKNGSERTIQAPADYVLCALGRSPSIALKTLNLRSAGVRLHAVTGHLILDSHLKTTASNIFAAGDCAGGEQFTHLAGYQGSIAAWNATMPWMAWQKAPSETEIPRCTFTDPEAAFIGLSLLENARRIYSDALETRLPLSQFDRAVCEGRSDGFVCIIHRGTAGVILGASAVGMNAGELISEMALAIKKKLTVADVATTMHPYPTLSFGLQVLAANQLAASLKDLVNSSFFSCFRICFCGPKLQGNSSSVPVSQNDSKVGLSAASSSFSL